MREIFFHVSLGIKTVFLHPAYDRPRPLLPQDRAIVAIDETTSTPRRHRSTLHHCSKDTQALKPPPSINLLFLHALRGNLRMPDRPSSHLPPSFLRTSLITRFSLAMSTREANQIVASSVLNCRAKKGMVEHKRRAINHLERASISTRLASRFFFSSFILSSYL
jgi:hypothetical protein